MVYEFRSTYIFESLRDEKLVVEIIYEGDRINCPFVNGRFETDHHGFAKLLIEHELYGKSFRCLNIPGEPVAVEEVKIERIKVEKVKPKKKSKLTKR